MPRSPLPYVLLLGCGHWANTGLDRINSVYDDMLAPSRQREIEACAGRLARFRPTKVAVELDAKDDDAVNDEYHRYRANTFQLTARERHQLGFRIAAGLGHERIYPINWDEGAGDLGLPFDFAHEHQPELYRELTDERDGQPEDLQPDMSGVPIVDMLRDMNAPLALQESHRVYLTLAQVGEGSNYVGIDWVKGWYQRNLIIFANLCRVATDPADRILVVYGAGHIPLLSQFTHDSGRFRIEPVEPYLGDE